MSRLAASAWRTLWRLAFYLRCRHRTVTLEQRPPAGKCIFIANHLITRGPMYVTCYMPFPAWIWINANLVDRQRFVENASKRYLEPVLHIRPPLSRWLATLAHVVWHPVFDGLGTVAVHSEPARTRETMSRSLAILERGDNLVAFPELEHHDSRVSRFHRGIAHLVRRFHRRTGQAPSVIPMAMDSRANMLFGQAVPLDEATIRSPDACTRALEEALAAAHRRLLAITGSER